jgi:hypothetical protein
MMNLDTEGVYRLIQEIVKQSARDWRDAMRCLRKNPYNFKANMTAVECELFFMSDYFYLLTGVDGEQYMQRIGQQYGFDA